MSAAFKKYVSLLCLVIGMASMFAQSPSLPEQLAQGLICEASDNGDSFTRIHKERPVIVASLDLSTPCEGINQRPVRIAAIYLYSAPLTTSRASRAPPHLV